MTRVLSSLLGISLLVVLAACAAEVPTEKGALTACQEEALTKIADGATARYRQHKTKIETLQAGPEDYAFAVYGEYFYKSVYSGDAELKFNCKVSKTPGADTWTMVAFDSKCIGGC